MKSLIQGPPIRTVPRNLILEAMRRMTKKKVYVRPHQRQAETGTEHVRGHTRNQETKGKILSNQEIPDETYEGILNKDGPKK